MWLGMAVGMFLFPHLCKRTSNCLHQKRWQRGLNQVQNT